MAGLGLSTPTQIVTLSERTNESNVKDANVDVYHTIEHSKKLGKKQCMIIVIVIVITVVLLFASGILS